MKDWWENLTQREQLMLIGGAALACLFLFYFFLWQPLSTSIDQNKQKVQSQQRLLFLMERAEANVQRFQAMGIDASSIPNQPLLALIEKVLSQRGLSQYIQSIKQTEPGSIEISLAKVPFDQVMQTIEALWDHATVAVTSMKAKKLDAQGVVDMQLVLRKQ